MNVRRALLPATFFAVLPILLDVAPSHAANPCPSGVIDISAAPYNGNYALTSDLERTGLNYDCLTFTGAGTVNLNGKTITTASGAAGSAAIVCQTDDIQIRDDAAPQGSITGTWYNSAIRNCANIRNVRIEANAARGVYNPASGIPLQELKNSYIDGAYDGVVSKLASRQSLITGNVIIAQDSGIEIDSVIDTGSGVADIVGNTIHGARYYGIYAPSSLVHVSGNLLSGPHPDLSFPVDSIAIDASSYDGNFCTLCSGLYDNCNDSACEYDSVDADPWDFALESNPAVCPGTVSGTFVLSQDYDLRVSSGSCITVSSTGTTVIDLNGHFITNRASGGTTSAAITCGAGTNVTVTDSTKQGGIRGRFNSQQGLGFTSGIVGCKTVQNIRIQDVDKGIVNTSTTNGLNWLTATVIDADDVVADTYLVDRTSRIFGNKFRSGLRGLHIRGVGTAGTGKAEIYDNAIRESHEFAIKVESTSNVNFHNNIMLQRDPAAIAPTASTCTDLGSSISSDLLCDCPDDCPDTTEPPIAYPF